MWIEQIKRRLNVRGQEKWGGVKVLTQRPGGEPRLERVGAGNTVNWIAVLVMYECSLSKKKQTKELLGLIHPSESTSLIPEVQGQTIQFQTHQEEVLLIHC